MNFKCFQQVTFAIFSSTLSKSYFHKTVKKSTVYVENVNFLLENWKTWRKNYQHLIFFKKYLENNLLKSSSSPPCVIPEAFHPELDVQQAELPFSLLKLVCSFYRRPSKNIFVCNTVCLLIIQFLSAVSTSLREKAQFLGVLAQYFFLGGVNIFRFVLGKKYWFLNIFQKKKTEEKNSRKFNKYCFW